MYNSRFELSSDWLPSGDQPRAIHELLEGLGKNYRYQTLVGVTGSGKTFTIANVIHKIQRPTLVLAHNKTLAAQLFSEFKMFFPNNAVHYFVSYYDYYQPEAYIPSSDSYIEKDASINERIERLRLATTKALLERRDVIVVASVSCIYGLGKRKAYEDAVFSFSVGDCCQRRLFLEKLVENYYERNDVSLEPGNFRVRGDIVEIFPAYSDIALRISFFDEEIESIEEIDPVSGHALLKKEKTSIFPAQHYVTSPNAIALAKNQIEKEMAVQVQLLRKEDKLLEAQRLESRTRYDLEMLSEVGYCSGIENYSRYLDGRLPGEPPGTLLDFFPKDFLMVIDESHMTLPQIRSMYNGDKARKETLISHGFRLPSCLDNRPLRWPEFEKYMKNVIFMSATPGDWELDVSVKKVEQLIRPTGVVDPEVVIVPAKGQVDDLIERLRKIVERGQRALVTTLTKKASEDLADYLANLSFSVKYIHSELNTFERAELIDELRNGTLSILVGINLLREGMDLPEVTLVAILDADREGFLRSYRSLIQIMGRAARNIDSTVVLYADVLTDSIRNSVAETKRRRSTQIKYNKEQGIVPRTISKSVTSILPQELIDKTRKSVAKKGSSRERLPDDEIERMMWKAVEKLDFERAAELRDLLSNRRGGAFARVASHKDSGRKGTQSKKYKRRNPQE